MPPPPIRRISCNGPYESKVGYCRAVVAGGWVHVSGTVASVDAAGAPPAGAPAQCASALHTISAALAEAGAVLGDVVRVRYMLPDMAEFAACWPQLRDAFGENPPAATCVECGLVDLKFRIEIEVTAYVG